MRLVENKLNEEMNVILDKSDACLVITNNGKSHVIMYSNDDGYVQISRDDNLDETNKVLVAALDYALTEHPDIMLKILDLFIDELTYKDKATVTKFIIQ